MTGRLRSAFTPALGVLVAILAAGLALRVANNDYGLPFVWSLDESTHFTNRAVLMFRDGLDPGYYQNPPLFTELLHGLLRVLYGPFGMDLPRGGVVSQFEADPERIWVVARTLIAILCMCGVAAAYWAGRRLFGVREGLVAAALLSFAFLPVAYSRVAVTDAGALAGIAIALLYTVRAAEDGRRRDFALAGLGIALAVSFKYSCGMLVLPLAIAVAARLREDAARALAGAAIALGVAGLAFALLNPSLILNLSDFRHDVRGQAEVTRDVAKPGQDGTGLGTYLGSLGWGFGWAGLAAALAGLVLLARRQPLRALLLAAFPLALFLYLVIQARWFGRWLLPAYPALALLAAFALARAGELVRRPSWGVAALAALTALVVAQPLVADLRTAAVLGRDDTREQLREFLAAEYPPELRVAIEPAVPGRYYRVDPAGQDPPWLRRCARGWSYPAAGGRRVCRAARPGQFVRPAGGVRASAYHLVIDPEVVAAYRRNGYCLVATLSLVRDRALASGDAAPRAYYRRLERESDLLREFSPYDAGADPVAFDFDRSYDYEPAAYARPGPLVRLYRLRDCRQGYGPPANRIPESRGI
jgi:hypothetical protein